MDSTGNDKHNQIMDTAKELFWKYGIKRVTVEEICREAEVSKATFYKYFSNKTGLVKQLMTRVGEEALAKYDRIWNQDIPYPEKVKGFMKLKKEQTDNMSREFYDDYMLHADPELAEFLASQTAGYMKRLRDDYATAQKRGDIRKNIKPEFIIYMINHLYDLASSDEHLINMYDSPQELALEILDFFLYGIMPHDESE